MNTFISLSKVSREFLLNNLPSTETDGEKYFSSGQFLIALFHFFSRIIFLRGEKAFLVYSELRVVKLVVKLVVKISSKSRSCSSNATKVSLLYHGILYV